MKVSIVEKEPPHVIQEIWQKHHVAKEYQIARTLTAEQYYSLKKNLSEAPMFIYPVKRDGGHFMLIGQMQDNVLVIQSSKISKFQNFNFFKFSIFSIFC